MKIKNSGNLNVELFTRKRAQEIYALARQVSTKAGKALIHQRLPHHLRRRTACLNLKKLPLNFQQPYLKKLVKIEAKAADAKEKLKKGKKVKRLFRRHLRLIRRKLKFQKEQNLLRKLDDTPVSILLHLKTHVYHAKRFRLLPIHGYYIPVHSNSKNFRHLNHCMNDFGCVVDVSYYMNVLLKHRKRHLNLIKQHVVYNENDEESVEMYSRNEKSWLVKYNNITFPVKILDFFERADKKGYKMMISVFPCYLAVLVDLLKVNEIQDEYIIEQNISRYRLHGQNVPNILNNILNKKNKDKDKERVFYSRSFDCQRFKIKEVFNKRNKLPHSEANKNNIFIDTKMKRKEELAKITLNEVTKGESVLFLTNNVLQNERNYVEMVFCVNKSLKYFAQMASQFDNNVGALRETQVFACEYKILFYPFDDIFTESGGENNKAIFGHSNSSTYANYSFDLNRACKGKKFMKNFCSTMYEKKRSPAEIFKFACYMEFDVFVRYFLYQKFDKNTEKDRKAEPIELLTDTNLIHLLSVFYNEKKSVNFEPHLKKHNNKFAFVSFECKEGGKVQKGDLLYSLSKKVDEKYCLPVAICVAGVFSQQKGFFVGKGFVSVNYLLCLGLTLSTTKNRNSLSLLNNTLCTFEVVEKLTFL